MNMLVVMILDFNVTFKKKKKKVIKLSLEMKEKVLTALNII